MPTIAILPAAGRSTRMGRPKLLLPWRGITLLAHVLGNWRRSAAKAVIVVVHPEDEEIAKIVRAAGAEAVIAPAPPPDMRASVQLGLRWAAEHCGMEESDAWLLAPADCPQITAPLIDRIAAARNGSPESIVVPVHGRRRGHPVAFPWPLAAEVEQLGENEGVNALLARHPVVELVVGVPGVLVDLDTPEDYRRLGGRPNA